MRVAGACALVLGVSAGGLLTLAAGCHASAEAHFTGHPQPPVVGADDVEILGLQAPAYHKVIGVITARCETLNGATGVLEDACSDDSLTELIRRQAAENGAHAVAELSCRRELLERTQESVDGGGVQTTTRERLTCQATALRRSQVPGRSSAREDAPRVARPAPSASHRAAPAGGREVHVGDARVLVSFERAAAYTDRPARSEAEIGELDHAPAGYEALGRLGSECKAACRPSQARRGLVAEAARVGATGLAEVQCELEGGDRWRCEAVAIGDPLPSLADAGPE